MVADVLLFPNASFSFLVPLTAMLISAHSFNIAVLTNSSNLAAAVHNTANATDTASGLTSGISAVGMNMISDPTQSAIFLLFGVSQRWE